MPGVLDYVTPYCNERVAFGEPISNRQSVAFMIADITLRCVALCQSLGYSENHLLEKFARDFKILDIFEGTQQIQQLIVARRVLGKSSSELK
jgi:alkylation response protein AidB-like acyl-CoA dehydrogenase